MATKITHCPQGHKYQKNEWSFRKNGDRYRRCKPCNRIRAMAKDRVNGVREQGTYSRSVTDAQAEQIVKLLKGGKMYQKDIAEIVGCSQAYVSGVKRGKVKWCKQ
jgi:hypothetical protein